jgi:hypothetical protein
MRGAGAGKITVGEPTSFQERGLARTPRGRLNLGLQTALFPRELPLEQLLKGGLHVVIQAGAFREVQTHPRRG